MTFRLKLNTGEVWGLQRLFSRMDYRKALPPAFAYIYEELGRQYHLAYNAQDATDLRRTGVEWPAFVFLQPHELEELCKLLEERSELKELSARITELLEQEAKEVER